MERVHKLVRSERNSHSASWAAAAMTAFPVVCALVVWACSADVNDASGREGVVSRPAQSSSASDYNGEAWMPEAVRGYRKLFVAAGAKHRVNPQLLAVIAAHESRGDANAKSPLGARGLMQLMPKTAEAVARQRGLKSHSTERLLDPSYNIDLGATYLADLAEDAQLDASGMLTAAQVGRLAASYNAGPGRARAHYDKGKPLSRETTRYVAKVKRTWRQHVQKRP